MPTALELALRIGDLRGELGAQLGIAGPANLVLLHRELRAEHQDIGDLVALVVAESLLDRRQQLIEVVDALHQARLA